VLGDVPKDQRCQCNATASSGESFASRIFGGLFNNKG